MGLGQRCCSRRRALDTFGVIAVGGPSIAEPPDAGGKLTRHALLLASATERVSQGIETGENRCVIIAIADKLAQDESEWAPFEPSLAQQWMYPHTGFN